MSFTMFVVSGGRGNKKMNNQIMSNMNKLKTKTILFRLAYYIARRFNIKCLICWLNGMPKYYKSVWWNASCHMEQSKYPNVFDKNNEYIRCKLGVEVIMGKTKAGDDILYKVIKVWHTGGSDWLYETDSYICNMEFSHIVKSK